MVPACKGWIDKGPGILNRDKQKTGGKGRYGTPSKIIVVLLGAFCLLFAVCLLFREPIFEIIGRMLVQNERPVKSDVIVVLRGDRNYARVLEGAALFNRHYAGYIYVSGSITDQRSKRLEDCGVCIPSEKERLIKILIQLGVPQEKILAGDGKQGGGTRGEIGRIKAMMLRHGFKKVIIVTSWWHTRRTGKIRRTVFRDSGIGCFVVAAKTDISDPSNWWKYRYEFLAVLEEFAKLTALYLYPIIKPAFLDDNMEGG